MDRIKKIFDSGYMWVPVKNGEVDIAEFLEMVNALMANRFNCFNTAYGYLGGESKGERSRKLNNGGLCLTNQKK